MVRDAESHADEDRRLRRVADARNAAEARIHEAERQLKDNGDKVDEEIRRDLEGAIAAAARPPRATTPTRWRPRPAASPTSCTGSRSRSTSRRPPSRRPPRATAPADETVEDAEYEVIDEDAPKAS